MILMCLGGQNSKGERFKGFAKQSISKSDTLLVAEAFQAHLAVVMRDRGACARWRASSRAYGSGSSPEDGGTLTLFLGWSLKCFVV